MIAEPFPGKAAPNPLPDSRYTQQSMRFGICGVFLFWGLWYDLKVMAGMIIAVSSELEECENVNVPETEEYLTA